jgi:DNA-binding LytR/AlgR family response regulator
VLRLEALPFFRNMKILLIEDEAPAARRLEKMIKEALPTAEIVAVLDSVSTSIEYLQALPALDLIFTDIQLADGLSFEIFEEVSLKCPLIFTTAYDEYALKAFKLNSIDYLLKPIDKKELENSLRKWQNLRTTLPENALQQNLAQLLAQLQGEKKEYKSRFLVKVGEKLMSISENEIAYFQAEEKIVFLHTQTGKKYVVDYTLDELEGVLNPQNFFRLNRQFLVHISSIKSINTYFNGKLKIQLVPETSEEVIVSREKSPTLKEWLDR